MAGMNGTPSNNAPVTIFVVDDEPMLLEMAVMILEPLNFRVRTFAIRKRRWRSFPRRIHDRR